MNLKARIESLYSQNLDTIDRHSALQTFNELKFFLNIGDVRAAIPSPTDRNRGGWVVNDWVKKGIVLGFRLGELIDVSLDEHFRYFDINTYPLKKLTLEHQVRVVPGGSSIRDGSYVASNVDVMPPATIDVGAYVERGTMIESHVLIGSCAQIGKRVYLSAGVQIGGVMEPVSAMPVIVEDDVYIGGNSGVFEGTIVQRRAIIAAGVNLTASTPVYDVINEKIYRRTKDIPLIIPEGAVVVPGSRALRTPFAQQHQLTLSTPIIMKYRDSTSDAPTVLEESF